MRRFQNYKEAKKLAAFINENEKADILYQIEKDE